MSDQEIWLIPFFGQGHLLPTMELCNHVASRNLKPVLVISSNLSSTIPSSFHHQLLILEVAQLSLSPPHLHHTQMGQAIENLICTRSKNPGSSIPVCAIVDVMMSWTGEIFKKFEIPTVGFFTSGACSGAMEYAMWKAQLKNLKPGEIHLMPGLPEDMAVTCSDLKRSPHHGPPGPPPGGIGPPPSPRATFHGPPGCGFGPFKMEPPKPGSPPPWLEETHGSIALMMNTCNFLELPFINYITNQIEKPVWGVGPLLPEQYWKSSDSIFHDNQFRANKRSNITEDEIVTWLNSKSDGSVIYVSFGSEVSPSMEEYFHLAKALETINKPFIWVIQLGSSLFGPPGLPSVDSAEGYFPHGLDKKVGDRGLIIHGWAPQLLILSHPATGGFLSHCGWNSTVEAIGRGKPILAWPIRGDQYYNAQLIVKHLKVGSMISDDMSRMVSEDDIIKGIERVLGDEQVKTRATLVGAQFENGFPVTSVNSLDAFRDFINHKYRL